MPDQGTSDGGTQCICVSAAGPQELSWDRTVDDGRVVCMAVVTPRRRLKPSTTQPSSARRLSGADATPTTTAVVGEVSELGRVPSGPWLGPTGTAGPADCVFNVHDRTTHTTSRGHSRRSRRPCTYAGLKKRRPTRGTAVTKGKRGPPCARRPVAGLCASAVTLATPPVVRPARCIGHAGTDVLGPTVGSSVQGQRRVRQVSRRSLHGTREVVTR